MQITLANGLQSRLSCGRRNYASLLEKIIQLFRTSDSTLPTSNLKDYLFSSQLKNTGAFSLLMSNFSGVGIVSFTNSLRIK
ncbi:hypothetical protein SAMN03159284_00073 [Mucilaginibacter sp. NFR10]|nr:hypothetical protein SAMN03159284_00073 [Mucilaginibacter sp. NFR10]